MCHACTLPRQITARHSAVTPTQRRRRACRGPFDALGWQGYLDVLIGGYRMQLHLNNGDGTFTEPCASEAQCDGTTSDWNSPLLPCLCGPGRGIAKPEPWAQPAIYTRGSGFTDLVVFDWDGGARPATPLEPT